MTDLKNASPRATGPPPAAGVTRSPTPTIHTSDDPTPVPQQWEDDDGVTNYLSTVPTDGGWAKIQWNSSKVLVIDTLPGTGYTSKVQQQSDTRVSISFESAANTATIAAWWDDGQPQLDVDNGNG